MRRWGWGGDARLGREQLQSSQQEMRLSTLPRRYWVSTGETKNPVSCGDDQEMASGAGV